MGRRRTLNRQSSFTAGDVWGGLASMLVALPSSIAFGVLVFSAIDPALAAHGALFGMLGAAVLGLLAPLTGGTPGLVTAPCAPAAAILAGLAAALVAADLEPTRVVTLLGLTVVMAAVLQSAFGLAGGGRFIKYIPHPVVSGYLSGVALIIVISQMPKLIGVTDSWQFIDRNWHSISVGAVTIGVMLAAPRFTRKVPAAILGLVAGIAAYLVLAWLDPALRVLEGNALVIGPVETTGSLAEVVKTQFQGLGAVRLADVGLVAYTALALAALLSIDTLKTCVILDAMTHTRHNSNRELLGQGAANFGAFLTGGMPGAGTLGPTLVNVTSGGTTRWSGFIEGIFVVLAILLLFPLIAWVPLAALAGILVVVAFKMFDWRAFSLLKHRETRFDFAVIATVVIVAVVVGLIAASAAGIALAILLFIRDQIRESVLRRRASLSEISSKTRRLESARTLLAEHGELAAAFELQGNLFFGTTDQLYTEVEPDLQRRKWLLFDIRRVQSMDYTAANLFRQMQQRLAARGGALSFCGMPSNLYRRQDINQYMAMIGLTGGSVRVFDTRDEGLEWMEDRILEHAGWQRPDDLKPLELGEIELFADIDDTTLDALRACVDARSVTAGDFVFRSGDTGDEMFLLRRGTVRILLPLSGGKHHHLANYGRGDYFGEMAFLDYETRSADAQARSDCELYALSRSAFDARVRDNPALGARVYARLARAVSLRLRHTDVELRAIEER